MILLIQFNRTNIFENNKTATGTITRTGNLNVDIIVTLFSSDTSKATVPISVIILAGQSSATFTLRSIDNTIKDGNKIITVTAYSDGYISGASNITIKDNEKGPSAISSIDGLFSNFHKDHLLFQ